MVILLNSWKILFDMAKLVRMKDKEIRKVADFSDVEDQGYEKPKE